MKTSLLTIIIALNVAVGAASGASLNGHAGVMPAF